MTYASFDGLPWFRASGHGKAVLLAVVLAAGLGACDGQSGGPDSQTREDSMEQEANPMKPEETQEAMVELAEKAATVADYGTWASPISAEDLAGAVLGFSDLQVHDGVLYWREFRPREGGRNVVMRLGADGAAEAVTPEGFDVRSRVHEYGGTPYLAVTGGVYFVNFGDQHMYRARVGDRPMPVAAEEGLRYADCAADPVRDRLVCVREDHRGQDEAKNTIVAVPAAGGAGQVLFKGSDFVAYPRISPDGKRMAWISWDHPNMPWDTVSLWIADLDDDGAVSNARRLNEGTEESVLQPEWAPDGTLYFISDRSGWWNIHRWQGDAISVVHAREAEFGGPLWTLGTRYFEFLPDGRILARFVEHRQVHLGIIDPATGSLATLDLDGSPRDFAVAGDTVYAVLHYADDLPAIARLDLESSETDVLRRAGERPIGEDHISRARPITYPTSEGARAYAYYYPPVNPAFKAPEGAKPPLVVMVHGGPTGAAYPFFSLDKQFWTTRGFAVLDIDYRGSTGYGRSFRQALYGEWGIADVEDTVNGARHIADEGLADPDKLLIRGGSAGGFVVLAAMAFHDVFAAGANYFGVSDMEALATETHKFESRYMDQLVGPYPERKEVYVERSPINNLDGMSEPLIIFQGLEDKIVLPNQSERIFSALKEKGVPVAYLPFKEEQHGFRKAENRRRALESELYFYGKILGFKPADEIQPVDIHNLP